MVEDLLSVTDLGREGFFDTLERAGKIKDQSCRSLDNPSLGMLFEKPSTRTRISFEVAINDIGGFPVDLDEKKLQMSRHESLDDTAKVLSRYLDVLVARVYSHDKLKKLSETASIPVINGLSDFLHPCQALADIFTIMEKKGLDSNVCFVGDGNNVCNSLILASSYTGIDLRVATPEGYEPDERIVERARKNFGKTDGSLELFGSPEKAVRDADVVYTDVFVSMGDEKDRMDSFEGFQVDERFFNRAKNDSVFMHCLPARRGQEVTTEVIDGERSVVFDQAENRLHTEKAVLLEILEK